jgi:hypothetical protein
MVAFNVCFDLEADYKSEPNASEKYLNNIGHAFTDICVRRQPSTPLFTHTRRCK